MEKEMEVIQNLKDAGCGKTAINSFMQYYRSRDLKNGFRVLSRHRKQLLDEVHSGQKRIDCLDYLVYELNRTEGGR